MSGPVQRSALVRVRDARFPGLEPTGGVGRQGGVVDRGRKCDGGGPFGARRQDDIPRRGAAVENSTVNAAKITVQMKIETKGPRKSGSSSMRV